MNTTNKVIISLITLVIIVWGGYFLVNKNQGISNGKIRIGAIFMLSGVGANWGENSQRGADLAVEEVNNSGGINGKKIEIIYQDNQGDNSKEAVNALQNLLSQNIKIVLGPNWTPSGLAVAPIACEKGIVMISPSLGVGEFNESCDYLFNLWPHDDKLSEQLGKWLYGKGYRKVAVLGSNQEWEHAQAEAVKRGFEGAGGKILAYELVQKGETDFKPSAAKIKSANPDAVVFTNFTYEHLSARKLRELGVKVPFFSVLIDDEHVQGAAGAFEGAIAVTSFTPIQSFTEKFIAKYGKQPDIGSDTSYDAVKLITEAIKISNSTDPQKIRDYILSLSSYSGASGKMKFDGKGGVTKNPLFKIVKDNKIIPYNQ